jgi:hypothetical protein
MTLFLVLVGSNIANAGDFKYENLARYNVVYVGHGVLIVEDKETGKFGLAEDTMNRDIILPAEYDEIEQFRYGLGEDTYYASAYPCRFTTIRKDGKEGVVRNDVKIIFPLNDQYYVGTILYDEIALYDKTSTECELILIDEDGNITARQTNIYGLTELSEGLRAISRVSKLSQWEYVDENWNPTSLGKFDYAGPFSEGLARVKVAGKGTGFINTKGETVIPFGLYWEGEDRFHNGKVIVRYADDDREGYGVIDRNNNVVIPFIHSFLNFSKEDGVRIFYGPSRDNPNEILRYNEDGTPYTRTEDKAHQRWIVYNIKLNTSSAFSDYRLYLINLLNIYNEYYGKPLDSTGDIEKDALAAEKIMRGDRVAAGFNSDEEMDAYIQGVEDGTIELNGKPPMMSFDIVDDELYSMFFTDSPEGYINSRGKENIRKRILETYCKYKNIDSVADQSDNALTNIMKELANNDILYVFSDSTDCKIFMKNWLAEAEIKNKANAEEERIAEAEAKAKAEEKAKAEAKAKAENVATYYENASEWAIPELYKALIYGFITNRINDNMKDSITREEFCEVAVTLFEKLTGETATYGKNHFTDTTNPEIFKAFEIGIVNGVGNGKFAPNNLVTRQEISVMLYRVIVLCEENPDFSFDDVPKFKDEDQIASWSITPMRFMYKNGIIKGTGDGTMDPLGNTSREQAVLLVVRTYEKYMN